MQEKIPASRGAGLLFKQVMTHLHANEQHLHRKPQTNLVRRRVCSLSGALAGPLCKATRLESYHTDHQPLHLCSYHKQKWVQECGQKGQFIEYLDLPSEYDAWIQANHLPSLQSVLKKKCGWTERQFLAKSQLDSSIIEPVTGTILAIDPTIPRSHQKLRIRFTKSITRQNARLLVNGKSFKDITGKSFVDWPLSKGLYHFQIKIGNHNPSKKVSINVL